MKVLMKPMFHNNKNLLSHPSNILPIMECSISSQLKLRLLMHHVLIQPVQSSSQLSNMKLSLMIALNLQKLVQFSIFLKEDGSAQNVKIIISKEETIATDAKKIEQKKISRENQSIWAKPSLLKSKRKLLRLKKMEIFNLLWPN